ncbi:hypothetical protein [Pseudonocardia zijingensis]|uniref:hypothetical protein n=1 Tax=Pseudonocardia zijingensis TaxID=153376 RepID=UPI0031CE51A9
MPTATVPAWVVPPPGSVADAHALTHALVGELQGDDRAHRHAGACAAISWVVGLQPGPMTHRDGEPTTAAVRGEMMLGDAVAAGEIELPDAVWAALDVPPARPVTGHVGWAAGVAASLGWLLGVHTRPPVRLPRRLPDGSTPTAEQLAAEYVARTFGEPEARAEARRRAVQDAALYQRLAAVVASVH